MSDQNEVPDILFVLIAWSPIGYETYLAMREIYGPEKIILVTSRTFHPPESCYHLGDRHDFFLQTNEELLHTCETLAQLGKEILSRGGKFTLCAPQMGNFYVRALIESKLCTDLIIYDEGSSAYGARFSLLKTHLWLKKSIKKATPLLECFSVLQIDYDWINENYSRGVRFYDFHHKKLRSLISFFPEAFPGYEKINLPMCGIEFLNEKDTDSHIAILLPPIKTLSRPVEYIKYRNDIKNITSVRDHVNFVIKSHPSDVGIDISDYLKLLTIESAILYDNFIKERGLNPYREPAIIGFNTIITRGNSTEIYIKQLNILANGVHAD